MTSSKTYLNVPYAEKDDAKKLGARWDASNKKWYVPDTIDIAPFAKWQSEIISSKYTIASANKQKSQTLPYLNSPSSNNKIGAVITFSSIKDFVPYNGDEPPWE